MTTPVQLGRGYKPATVYIGGTRGVRTTAPVTVSVPKAVPSMMPTAVKAVPSMMPTIPKAVPSMMPVKAVPKAVAVPSMMPSVAAPAPTTKALSQVSQAERNMLYQQTGNAEMLTSSGTIPIATYEKAASAIKALTPATATSTIKSMMPSIDTAVASMQAAIQKANAAAQVANTLPMASASAKAAVSSAAEASRQAANLVQQAADKARSAAASADSIAAAPLVQAYVNEANKVLAEANQKVQAAISAQAEAVRSNEANMNAGIAQAARRIADVLVTRTPTTSDLADIILPESKKQELIAAIKVPTVSTKEIPYPSKAVAVSAQEAAKAAVGETFVIPKKAVTEVLPTAQVSIVNVPYPTKAVAVTPQAAYKEAVGESFVAPTIISPALKVSGKEVVVTTTLTSANNTKLHIMSYTPAQVTDQEAKDIIKSSLDEMYPGGELDGTNQIMVDDFSSLALTVAMGINDYSDATEYMKDLYQAEHGVPLEFETTPGGTKVHYGSAADFEEWATVDKRIKKDRMASVLASGLTHNINPELISYNINHLILSDSSLSDEDRIDYYHYITDGSMSQLANSKMNPIDVVWRGVTSEKGSTALGVISAGALIIGGALVGGPAGAVAGAGMTPFAIDEIKTYTGMADFRTKTNLQNRGAYPPDVDSAHDFSKNDIEASYKALGFNAKDMTIAQINDAKAKIQKSIDNERAAIKKDGIPLIAAGTYKDKLDALDSLEQEVKVYTPKTAIINPVTGKPQEVPTESALESNAWKNGVPIKVTAPENITYTVDDQGEATDQGYLNIYGPGEHSITFYENGVPITSRKQTIYDPHQTYQMGISAQEIQDEKRFKPETQPSGYVHFVGLPAGATVKINDKPVDTKYINGYCAQKGQDETIVVSVKAPGYEERSFPVFIKAGKSQTVSLTPTKAEWKVNNAPGVAIFTGLVAGSTVKIDGKEVNADALYGFQGDPGQEKSIVVSVKTPGYEERNVTVYLKPGEPAQEVSLAPTKKEFVPYEREGGGSGGSSGGEGGEKPPEQALIVFGPSLAGARIWLDGTEIAPEIGKPYAEAPGYHAVKATKEGYREWNKTIYAMEGPTPLNIDAAFEPTTTTPVTPPEETKSYLIFGTTIVGATVYVDDQLFTAIPGVQYELAYGYHGIKITKPDKVDWLKNVYIAKGDTLTVSPIFEDKPIEIITPPTTPTKTTKRVYINTKPDGAKILINNGFTGQWTPAYLDLERGIYKLTITKTGYTTKNSYIYVGDTITFGDTALSLARLANLEIPT